MTIVQAGLLPDGFKAGESWSEPCERLALCIALFIGLCIALYYIITYYYILHLHIVLHICKESIGVEVRTEEVCTSRGVDNNVLEEC